MVKEAALANGASDAVIARHYSEGGSGALDLADSVLKVTTQIKPNFRFLYDLNLSIEDKISRIATEMYGAGSVDLEEPVKKKLKLYYEQVN